MKVQSGFKRRMSQALASVAVLCMAVATSSAQEAKPLTTAMDATSAPTPRINPIKERTADPPNKVRLEKSSR